MAIMAQQTTRADFKRGTLARLRALAGRLRVYLLLDGLAILSTAILAVVLITLAIDYTLHLNRDMRLVQATTLLLALAWLTWQRLLRPLSVPITDIDLAILVERRHPHLRSGLISATEFSSSTESGRQPGHHPAMVAAVIRQAEEAASSLRFTDVLNHRRARRRASVLLAVCAVLSGMLLLEPSVMGLWFDRNVLLRNVDWPLRNRLIVEGLTDDRLVVPRGEDITVSAAVDPGYEPPRQVYIHYRGESGARGQQQMPETRGQPVRFTHTFERVSESLECRVTGGDAETPPFTVALVDRPTISGLRIGIAPPGYTHVDPYELRPGQTAAEALIGSEIRLHIIASQPIASAKLVRESGGSQHVVETVSRIGDREFAATDRPSSSAAYSFELTDKQGLSSTGPRVLPMRIIVRLVTDQPPAVKMRIRGAGDMITPQAVLPIETDFSDAYGLASARIVHASSKSQDKPMAEPLPDFEPPAKTFTHAVDWSVADHGLAQGDQLSLWAEATDFDDVSGPNLGKSSPARFRIVSREELLTELNRRQQEYRQDFERYLRRQEELYSDLLSLSRPPGSTADRQERGRRFRQLARQQRDQTSQVNAVAQRFEQVLSELRINRLSTPDVENRLGGGVVEPIRQLTRGQMPPAAELLDELSGREDAQVLQQAESAQAAIRNEMNAILARMLEWERFQEAVILLRDVLHMQENVGKETESQIEKAILGTGPASEPSK